MHCRHIRSAPLLEIASVGLEQVDTESPDEGKEILWPAFLQAIFPVLLKLESVDVD